MLSQTREIHILLVEDNEGDILLTTEAFEERNFVNKISVAKNGRDALNFLRKQGEFSRVERPDLVLLDINIPMVNGLEVLRAIKSDKELRKIPVVMLTTSTSQKDIDEAYINYANSYISKPQEMEDFLDAILKIEEFWFRLVKLSN